MLDDSSKNDSGAATDKLNWGPLSAVLVTLGLYFGTQILAAAALILYTTTRGLGMQQAQDWSNTVGAQFIYVLLTEGLTVWLLYNFLKRRQSTFKTIGLNKFRVRYLGYALAGFAAYLPLYIGVVNATKALIPSLNLDQKQDLGFNNPHGAVPLILVALSLIILPPIVEELMIRGFLYSGLKRGLPKVWAVLITSAIFAAAHLQFGSGAPLLWVAAIDTFILSLVLIYLREKTGSLWPGIGLHMIKNSLAFLALFVFTR